VVSGSFHSFRPMAPHPTRRTTRPIHRPPHRGLHVRVAYNQSEWCLRVATESPRFIDLHCLRPATMTSKANAPKGASAEDPIILLSSDDEDEEIKEPIAKKRRTDTNTGTGSSNTNTFHFRDTRAFCLILIVDPDDECRQYLQKCGQMCSSAVHDRCFQQEGTLHFTLATFDGRKGNPQELSYNDAMRISFDVSKLPLPVFNLTGYKDWKNCVALTTDTPVNRVVNGLSGMFPPISTDKVQNKLHMSVYRMRLQKENGEYWNGPVFKERSAQFDRVRRQINGGFGTAKGVRIVLKEMGADYHGLDGKFFRVIAE